MNIYISVRYDQESAIKTLMQHHQVSLSSEDICNRRDINARQEHIAHGMHMVTSGRKPPTAIWLLSSLRILGGSRQLAPCRERSRHATRKSVAVAFSPRVGKKEEREIHWRYGLVSARVERTTCGKKKKGRKERKRKKERFLLGLSSAPRILEQETAWTFCGSESFIIETVWIISTFNGAKRELSTKYSRVREERLLLLSWNAKRYLRDSHERLQTVFALWKFNNRVKIAECGNQFL